MPAFCVVTSAACGVAKTLLPPQCGVVCVPAAPEAPGQMAGCEGLG